MKQKMTFIMIASTAVLMLNSCTAVQMNSKAYSIKELAPDGAWTWYNDERTIVDGQQLLIGSMDSQGVSRVDLYDIKTGLTIPFPLSSWKSKDDHNNPALLKMSNGQILAVYAKHTHKNDEWNWRIGYSGEGSDKLKWDVEETFGVPSRTTYSNLVQLSAENGRIYNFSRSVNYNPNIQYSDDMAKTWQGPYLLLKTGKGDTRPYVKYCDNGKDRIDFLYTDGHPRNEPTNNVYHLYYKGGSFFKTDGTLIKTMQQVMQDPMVPTDGTLIYDGNSEGRGWAWDIEYDQQGCPAATFINSADHEEGNDLRYRYARWDDKSKKWTQQQIAYAGTHIYVPENHYAGGISIDPQDVNKVYISCNVDPVTGHANETGHFQIYHGQTNDNGKSWRWKQLTFDSDVDNLRPIVPRNNGLDMCVIWFQGKYKTFKNYKARIVGIIEP